MMIFSELVFIHSKYMLYFVSSPRQLTRGINEDNLGLEIKRVK